MERVAWDAWRMADPKLMSSVERIVRDTAVREIMPRFGRLRRGDIEEKRVGEIVTTADRATERALAAQLTTLLPGSLIVGEEGVAEDPGSLGRLSGDKPVWIIDPIDGTENFVASKPRFATLVSLFESGSVVASWTFAPALGIVATAAIGQGAWINGRRVTVGPAPSDLRDLVVSVPQPRWWTERQRAQFDTLRRYDIDMRFFDTVGLEYLELACGRRTATVLTWQHPWDHSAGILLHAEAGGTAMSASGKPYDLAGVNALPIVVAPDAQSAHRIQAVLSSAVPE
jgi:fructose-1,6-bisphosphatase/inositol monophosphatase family enzyme